MPLLPLFDRRLSLPVMASLLFIVSGSELVIEQCKAGILDSFPSLNARPIGTLDDRLARAKDKPGTCAGQNPALSVARFAVNQICHPSNDRLHADMEICVKHRGPVIITCLHRAAAAELASKRVEAA
ncbi:hypothetical protein [Bradyrhizobium sp. CCBAU 11434]|uniref:hypothetical protein n=1 Tax=Bradyrhizobium sp. CCBAU 11434 TaxID=1630885 RepID=UPI0023068EC4|nr:hypothetical protein [Bradyrhizobium sp. CCBAU 11434]